MKRRLAFLAILAVLGGSVYAWAAASCGYDGMKFHPTGRTQVVNGKLYHTCECPQGHEQNFRRASCD